jgi:hypothetical protein
MSITGLVDDIMKDKDKAIIKPAGESGLEGWVFDIPQEESLRLQKDITDHYTEDGSYLNDHVVHKPLEITLRGLVGELVDFYEENSVLGKVEGLAGSLNNRLTALDAYGMSDLTPQALQTARELVAKAQYAAAVAKQIKQRAESVIGFLNGEEQKTRQEEMYDTLIALYGTDQLLSVVTPWGYFPDMVIQSIDFTQGEESEEQTDISLTLKQLRVTQVYMTDFSADLFGNNRSEMQEAGKVDTGVHEGVAAELESTLSKGVDTIGSFFQ